MGKYNKKNKKKFPKEKKLSVKDRLDILEHNWMMMERNIRYIFQILQNYRMFRLHSNLKGEMIPSDIPNPTCKYLDLKTAVCGCEWCMHFKKTCFFSAYMKDCVHMRGKDGEIPEIYEKHGKIPEDMQHKKKGPVEELIDEIKEDREKEADLKIRKTVAKAITGEEEIKELLESEKKKCGKCNCEITDNPFSNEKYPYWCQKCGSLFDKDYNVEPMFLEGKEVKKDG